MLPLAVSLRRGLRIRKLASLNPLAACPRPVCEVVSRVRVPAEAIEDETALEHALLLEISRLSGPTEAFRALERVEARHSAGEFVGLRRGASLFARSDFGTLQVDASEGLPSKTRQDKI